MLYSSLAEHLVQGSEVFLAGVFFEGDFGAGVELRTVARPHLQLLHLLDAFNLGQVVADLADQLGLFAPVEEDDDCLLGDGEGGVDGHEGEEVGAEGVRQLPVGPLSGGEEENDAGGDDHPDGQDDVGEDVDVGGLDVDVFEVVGLECRGVHLLVRRNPGNLYLVVVLVALLVRSLFLLLMRATVAFPMLVFVAVMIVTVMFVAVLFMLFILILVILLVQGVTAAFRVDVLVLYYF